MINKYRTETDSMGEIKVDSSKYWDAQTQRSIEHFSIGTYLIPIEMIHSMGKPEKDTAMTNYELNILAKDKLNYISN